MVKLTIPYLSDTLHWQVQNVLMMTEQLPLVVAINQKILTQLISLPERTWSIKLNGECNLKKKVKQSQL